MKNGPVAQNTHGDACNAHEEIARKADVAHLGEILDLKIERQDVKIQNFEPRFRSVEVEIKAVDVRLAGEMNKIATSLKLWMISYGTVMFFSFAGMGLMLYQSLETRIHVLETRMQSIETRMLSLETRMQSLETRIESLETRMLSLEVAIAHLTQIIVAGQATPPIAAPLSP